MPDPDYLSLADCRTRADLDRLDPREYAELAGRPATMLDVFREKLDIAEALREIAKALQDAEVPDVLRRDPTG